jgi:DNA-binding HxlR family transcriptional regulator
MKSYDEYCAVAKSLDVVGDRWTLLIVRELSLRGPSRYTDLRKDLPGIATNLLADRLRDLEKAGVVAREEAPPPVATTLFRLTPRGEGLQPVLEDLTRWGLPLMTEQKDDDAVRSHWLAGTLESMLTDRRPKGRPVTLELQIGDQPIVVGARKDGVHVDLGPVEDADALLAGPAKPVMGLLLGVLDLAGAEAQGVSLEGDAKVLERLGPPADFSFGAPPARGAAPARQPLPDS